MKKCNLNLITLSLFLSSILLFSCEKEAKITHNYGSNDSVSIEQIQTISNNYQDEISVLKKDDPDPKPWQTILKIVGKDLTGCVSGGAVGFAIGTAAPGVGNGVGLMVGALVGGAGASLTEAGSSIYNPSGNLGNQNAYNVNFENYTSNEYNNLDSIGLNHYLLCNNFIISIDEEQTLEDFYLYGLYEVATSYNISMEYALTLFDIDFYNSIINFTQDTNTSLTEKISYLYEEGSISNTVKEIMTSYIESFEASLNVSSFINYSIIIENIITYDTDMDEKDKMLMLSSMATARYGIQYWYDMID